VTLWEDGELDSRLSVRLDDRWSSRLSLEPNPYELAIGDARIEE